MNDTRFDHYVWRFSEELSLDQSGTDHARTILAEFEDEILKEVAECLESYKLPTPFFIIPPGDLEALKRGEIPQSR